MLTKEFGFNVIPVYDADQLSDSLNFLSMNQTFGVYEDYGPAGRDGDKFYKFKGACDCECLMKNGFYKQKSKIFNTRDTDNHKFRMVMNRTEFDVEKEWE